MSREFVEEMMENRLMRSQSEIERFEKALESYSENPDKKYLPDLHLVLDDKCKQMEVMFGLIHYLETFDVVEQLSAFLEVLPTLSRKSPEWTQIINFRILNDKKARLTYKSLINKSTGDIKQSAINSIKSISLNEKGPLKDFADYLLR